MQEKNTIIESGKAVVKKEIEALTDLLTQFDDEFEKAVQILLQAKGRIVLTGIGKSGIIANKISATLNSTGTPAMFMHAADAIHGDLGMIRKEDIIVLLSKSGESPEIKALFPFISIAGSQTIAICGNKNSFLGKNVDIYLNAHVKREADPNNLSPTSSTTVQLAIGDALAVCLLQKRGFSSTDFARFHPGGALGKRLLLKVGDLIGSNLKPEVDINADLKAIIIEISRSLLGATAVLDRNKLAGIITDGDLRRMLEKGTDLNRITAEELYSRNPVTIEEDALAILALEKIRSNNITQLIVTKNGVYTGMIHVHNLLKNGII